MKVIEDLPTQGGLLNNKYRPVIAAVSDSLARALLTTRGHGVVRRRHRCRASHMTEALNQSASVVGSQYNMATLAESVGQTTNFNMGLGKFETRVSSFLFEHDSVIDTCQYLRLRVWDGLSLWPLVFCCFSLAMMWWQVVSLANWRITKTKQTPPINKSVRNYSRLFV